MDIKIEEEDFVPPDFINKLINGNLEEGLGISVPSTIINMVADVTVDMKYEKTKIEPTAEVAPMPIRPLDNHCRIPEGLPVLPKLQNVVTMIHMNCKLDLKKIALHARNAEYNPKRFAAVIMRIREPKSTALIFASGKMVCTGTKSEDDSKLAARKYVCIIRKLGFGDAKFDKFAIQNVVGSCDIGFTLHLEPLVHTYQVFCTYEPETFPGVVYRMVDPKTVLLIFASGKIVLTGAKSRQQIYDTFAKIYPILCCFKR